MKTLNSLSPIKYQDQDLHSTVTDDGKYGTQMQRIMGIAEGILN